MKSSYMIKMKLELENISPLWSGKDESCIIDKENKKIKIFGSSIFGAIKNSLNEQINEKKDKLAVEKKLAAEAIFGSFKTSEDNQKESKVFISDLKSKGEITAKLQRPGIRINNKSGSTINGGIYNSNLIPKGNKFILSIEAKLSNEDEKEKFKKQFDSIILAIQNRKICFGGNKTKGFGQFKINNIWKKEFDLSNKEELIEYLDWKDSIDNMEKEETKETPTENNYNIYFKGKIKDSFLLKGKKEGSEHKIQYSYKEDKNNYIIPSNTIKGSMRSYFGKILNTLNDEIKNEFIHSDEEKSKTENPCEYKEIIELLGHNPDERINKKQYQIGKLIINDCEIQKVEETEYHRIKIDRFTGGVMNGSLINESRLTNGEIEIKISSIKELTKQEKGLLILYFRDLGLGKITLGSNSSVGSGRIEGKEIRIDDIALEKLSDICNKQKEKIDKYISALLKEVK